MSTPALADELSSDFRTISNRLTNASGIGYLEFRKTLRPKFGQAWMDIALGYVGFLFLGAALWFVPRTHWPVASAAAVAASIGFGYIHHYLALFMHESAHYNLVASRRTNDLLANVFLGVLQCYSVETYRPTHFGHHREVGLPEDPERHYFHALDLSIVILTLSGIRPALAVYARLFSAKAAEPSAAPKPESMKGKWVVFAGALLHGTIVVGAFLAGKWPLGIAWAAGFLLWFPLFSTLRQILEHRDFNASKSTDYSKVPHGEVTRVFGDGPVSRTFGAAGFSRHLLHHWEPQISYTRLADLERFLLESEAGPLIRAAQETYSSAFLKLVRKAK